MARHQLCERTTVVNIGHASQALSSIVRQGTHWSGHHNLRGGAQRGSLHIQRETPHHKCHADVCVLRQVCHHAVHLRSVRALTQRPAGMTWAKIGRQEILQHHRTYLMMPYGIHQHNATGDVLT